MRSTAPTFGLLLALAVAGCSAPEDATTSPSSSAGLETPRPQETAAPLRMLIAGHPVSARLLDNDTARDLADQLPLSVTIRDLNGVEKVAKVPRALSMHGVPEGADPDIGDIGYYEPTQELVLYYGDVGYWNGIVRIGAFDRAQLSLVESQADGVDVTFERA